MTLLEQFNSTIREMPTVSKRLERLIIEQNWDIEKTLQAIKIVQQLRQARLIETVEMKSCTAVVLVTLTITLTPSECGIDSGIFDDENIDQATQHIGNLLDKINSISGDLKFSLGGHSYDFDKCTFKISWVF